MHCMNGELQTNLALLYSQDTELTVVSFTFILKYYRLIRYNLGHGSVDSFAIGTGVHLAKHNSLNNQQTI